MFADEQNSHPRTRACFFFFFSNSAPKKSTFFSPAFWCIFSKVTVFTCLPSHQSCWSTRSFLWHVSAVVRPSFLGALLVRPLHPGLSAELDVIRTYQDLQYVKPIRSALCWWLNHVEPPNFISKTHYQDMSLLPKESVLCNEQPDIRHLKRISAKVRVCNVAWSERNSATCYRAVPCPLPPGKQLNIL